jgi:hypothetical protein
MPRRALFVIAVSLSVFVLTLLMPAFIPVSQAQPAGPAAATASGLFSRDDREMYTPTGWLVLAHQTVTDINNTVAGNNRIVDVHLETTAVPHLFSVAYVDNSGVYARPGWGWAYDQTEAQIATLISGATIRIISFKAYELSPGNLRFVAVWIPNSGVDDKNWHVWANLTAGDIATKLGSTDRLVQLTAYQTGGQTRYAIVQIPNSGDDNRQWGYATEQTIPQLSAVLSTTTTTNRLYDLDFNAATGKYSAIWEQWTQPPNWQWLIDVSAQQLIDGWTQFGSRIIDIQTRPGCGDLCYTALFLDNSDAVVSRVGHMLRAGIGGQANGSAVAVGLYLKRVGGPVLAALEPDFKYQPASSIKVVEELYAMRRVQAGTSTLNDQIVHYTNGASSCPNPPVVSGTEPLTTALKAMMRVSDNARTREISDTYGVANFTALMTNIGMSNSTIGELLGCAGNNFNRLTLSDISKLYEGVANGSLLTGQSREDFYFLMAGKEQAIETGGDFTGIWKPALDEIISEERPLGMTTAMTQTYKNKMRLNYKAGGYTFCQATCADVREYIAVTGLAQIPFCSGTTTTLRQFVFGTFLHGVEDASWFNGKNTLADQTFNATKAEVLREQVRAGLVSCFYQVLLPLVVR